MAVARSVRRSVRSIPDGRSRPCWGGDDVVVRLDRDRDLQAAGVDPSLDRLIGLEQFQTILEVERGLDSSSSFRTGSSRRRRRAGCRRSRLAPRSGVVRASAQRAGDEGVDDVERCDVDDDPRPRVAGGPAQIRASRSSSISVSARAPGSRRSGCGAARGSGRPRVVPSSGCLRGGRPIDHRVAEQSLGLLDAALEVTDRVHLAQIDTDIDQRLGDLGRESCDDHASRP